MDEKICAKLPIASTHRWSSGSAEILIDSASARLKLIRSDTAVTEQFTVHVFYVEEELCQLEPKKILKFLTHKKFAPQIVVNLENDAPRSITIELNQTECIKRRSKIITRVIDSISSGEIDTEGEIFSCRRICVKNIYLSILQLTKSELYREEKYTCIGAKVIEILSRSGHIFDRDDFQGANLVGADFRGVRSHGPLNFEGAVLIDCNFSGLNLNGYIFTGTNCEGAIFEGATNMTQAIGIDVNLIVEQRIEDVNPEQPLEDQLIEVPPGANGNDSDSELTSDESEEEIQLTRRNSSMSKNVETGPVPSSQSENTSLLRGGAPKSKGTLRSICRCIFCCCHQPD